MVLRKPYAFFIKYFRTFNFILSFLSVYLLVNMSSILSFYSDYSTNIFSLLGQDLKSIYISDNFIPSVIVMVLISMFMIFILAMKGKPIGFYLIHCCFYIGFFIFLQYLGDNFTVMSSQLVDIVSVRFIRDIVAIVFFIQIFDVIILFAYSFGLNLDKFDFKKDIDSMEITDTDREEILIDFVFDYNRLRTKIRNVLRKLQYLYLEQRLIFNCIMTVFLLFICYSGYSFIKGDIKYFDYGEALIANQLNLVINESYLVNDSSKGEIIDINNVYIIVKIDINSFSKDIDFEIATVKLMIGDYAYYHNNSLKNYITEFGDVYTNGVFGTDVVSNVLIFEIPKKLVDKKMSLNVINKSSGDIYGIKLNNIDLTNDPSFIEYKLGDEAVINPSYSDKFYLKIIDYEIKEIFTLYYQNSGYDFVKYILPSLNTRNDKVVLKLNGSLSEYEKNIYGVSDLYDLISKFGTLEYTNVDGTIGKYTDFEKIYTYGENLYIGVDDGITNAKDLSISFTLRDKIYKYYLK